MGNLETRDTIPGVIFPSLAELIIITSSKAAIHAASFEKPMVIDSCAHGETTKSFVVPFLDPDGEIGGVDVFYFEKESIFKQFRADGLL